MPPQILLDILSEADEKVVGMGEVVVQEGEVSNCFYIIESGSLFLFHVESLFFFNHPFSFFTGTCEVRVPNSSESIQLHMGDLFGESVFRRSMHHQNRDASVFMSTHKASCHF